MKRIHIGLDKVSDNQLSLMSFHFADQCMDNGIDPIFLVANRGSSRFIGDHVFFNFADYYSKDGKFLVTSFDTYDLLKSFCGNIEIFLYCYDFEWITKESIPYDNLSEMYRNPKIKLGCRSEEHQTIFKKVWQVDAEVVGDLNFDKVNKWIFKK